MSKDKNSELNKDFIDYLKNKIYDENHTILDARNDYSGYNNSDFQAWDNCFEAFEKARKKQKLEDKDINYLCLHLTAYLAAWGMYRGSSFISKHDYKCHKKAIMCIMNRQYDNLLRLKITECTPEKVKNIILLYNEIKQAYKVYNEKCNPSDTLITKIMLGTLACVPGYDIYVTQALLKLGSQGVFPKEAEKLKNVFEKIETYNIIESVALKSMRDKNHPDMKIIDFCLFNFGKYCNNDKERSKYKK